MIGQTGSSAQGAAAAAVGQAEASKRTWSRDLVSSYADRTLLPVEVMILARHRDALSGRVLELGCGAGRVLGYLVALGAEAHGIDISPVMVEHCRRFYPQARVSVGDLGAPETYPPGPFDAILAMYNIIDIFDDAGRRRVLGALRESLAPDGIVVISAHNLAYVDARQGAGTSALGARQITRAVMNHPPAWAWARLTGLPLRIRNRRRLAPLQSRARDHAIINDWSHEHGLLLYHNRREDQLRQFVELGYEVLDCLDVDGYPVSEGDAPASEYLHYVARPVSPG